MMKMTGFKEALKKHCMTNLKGRKQKTTDWITLPCPFCGDSPSNNNHFNIRISDDDDIIYMICYQPDCDVDRFPKAEDFITMGFSDLSLIKEYTSASIKTNVSRKRIIVDGVKYPEENVKEVETYITNRTYLGPGDFYKHKIIANIPEFLKMNAGIYDEGVIAYIKNVYGGDLNKCLGFLNGSNSKLQIRTIHKKDYKPYTLKGSSDKLWFLNDHDEFSVIHEHFDPLKTPVLVIGEGNFDRTNAVEIVGRPGMYVAGMNQKGVFRVLKKLTVIHHHVDVIVMSDDDVSLYAYREFVKKFGYRLTSFSVWYNMINKDFGEKDKVDINKIIKHNLV